MISIRRNAKQIANVFACALAVALFVPAAICQQANPLEFTAVPASETLPDAPGIPTLDTSSSLDAGAAWAPNATVTVVSHTDKYISPGESAPRIDFKDKFVLGVKDAFSPLSAVGWLVSAGYEQVSNGSPNYGSNATAFGKRFGAAALRSSSEGVFSDSIMSPIFHEDPRYYRMGSGHNFIKRSAYAVTRTLLTRTDSGHETINLGLLSGNLEGAYLTKAYYPDVNTTNPEVLKTFAGSVGGSALGFFVSEFLTLNLSHHDKP